MAIETTSVMGPARIHELSPAVIDQIAAGEVVERPSHLVKELMENSVDAKAKSIAVEVADGGRFVRVTDDGTGIHPDDLGKVLDRHTTSKIKDSDDLWRLLTYGFRGEALSSIAAVSDLKLTTKLAQARHASELRSEFGKRFPLEEVSGDTGTRIEIRELFANLPARLKFLKSPAAEVSAIRHIVKAFALAQPEIEFRFFIEGKSDFHVTPSDSRRERGLKILGVKDLLITESELEGYKMQALFTSPQEVQKTARNMWFFAQGRMIQDRSLQAAVMEAYRNTLMHGEYPSVLLWLEVPPDEIDVNIHPTKTHVKFLRPQTLFKLVHHGIRKELEKFSLAKTWSYAPPEPSPENLKFSAPGLDRVQFQTKELPEVPPAGRATQGRQGEILNENRTVSGASENQVGHFSTVTSSASSASAAATSGSSPTFANESAGSKAETAVGPWSRLQVLGQAHLTYIIAQSAEGICFVDQHAAHERVLFESLMAGFLTGQMDSQELLFPLMVDLPAEQIEVLKPHFDGLAQIGLRLEQMGPQTLGISSLPLIVKENAWAEVLSQMGRECLELGGGFSLERKFGDIAARLACHSAIRAGQALSKPEMEMLLKQMDEFAFSSFCPHGRPVSVNWGLGEIEREFGRRP